MARVNSVMHSFIGWRLAADSTFNVCHMNKSEGSLNLSALENRGKKIISKAVV